MAYRHATDNWDVQLLYGPEAEWIAGTLPQPELLMHQLRKLEGYEVSKA